jgi:hypothetical protein
MSAFAKATADQERYLIRRSFSVGGRATQFVSLGVTSFG